MADPNDILDLVGGGMSPAEALARALRARQLGGVLASSGNKGLMAGAASMERGTEGDLERATRAAEWAGNLTEAQRRSASEREFREKSLLQAATQFAQQQDRLAKESAQTASRDAQRLGLERERMDQDAWAAVPDQLGGVVLYNRKTGESKPMGPQNPGTPGPPKLPIFKSEDQSKSFSFTERIREARKQMEEAGYPEGMGGRKDAAAMGAQSGPISSLVPQEAASEPGSRYFNAARNLVAALLRKESGAAISNDEWKQFTGLYIPMPWDSPEARQNKLRLLDLMEKSMEAAAGPSAAAYWEKTRSASTPTAPKAGQPKAAPAPSAVPEVKTKAERDALPPGTRYTRPDKPGQVFLKE